MGAARLAAIVSADVAGYSRLLGRNEGGPLAALKALHRELLDRKIAEYGGRIVKTTGDGLLLEIPERGRRVALRRRRAAGHGRTQRRCVRGPTH